MSAVVLDESADQNGTDFIETLHKYFCLFSCSANRNHPVQSLWGQIEWSSLRCYNMRRLQGFLQAIPELWSCQLPVPKVSSCLFTNKQFVYIFIYVFFQAKELRR